MHKGDLSNEIPPRMIVVFDGLVGEIPATHQAEAKLYRRLGRWKKVASLYDINPAVRAQMHDVSWRLGWRLDVVTFDHEHVAEELAKKFDAMNLSVAHVYSVAGPQELRDSLPFMPEVRYVVHGMMEMQMMFGPRGRFGFGEVR